MKYLFPFLALLISSAYAQDELPVREEAVSCFDIKAGVSAFMFFAKKFNDEHKNVGNHGATAYPQTEASLTKGFSPYININGARRLSSLIEVSYGLSYMYYLSRISYYDKKEISIPNSVYYQRTIDVANVNLISHLYRLSFAPVFRIYNTKLEVGLLNIGYVNYTKQIIYQASQNYEVIPKHNSLLDSVVVTKEIKNISPDLELKNRLHISFSIGIEQEIPIKKYRYLVGLKGIVSSDVIAAIAYVGIRFSKPYTWRKS